jgi:hypothetical protein
MIAHSWLYKSITMKMSGGDKLVAMGPTSEIMGYYTRIIPVSKVQKRITPVSKVQQAYYTCE